jgi:hypothetical protein
MTALPPPAQACRSCDAPIRWVKTTTGKRMPLDAEPVPDGNLVLVDGVATVVDADAAGTRERYTSHFSTCPQAKSWRRK